ncbi:MAG TPA: histidine kinase, partial [Acidimicrobiales bacterium]|nr:histidine kinase [Acidimicrobiales bacterium]
MRLVTPRVPVSGYLPFLVVGVLGQVSGLWPPGPTSPVDYVTSCVLFVVAAVLLLWFPQWPGRSWLLMSGVYVASLALLTLSTGGMDSGLGALLFVPVVGVALYGEPWESAVVIGFALAAVGSVSAAVGTHFGAADPRRLFFFTCVAAFLSVAVQALRHRLRRSNRRTKRLLTAAEASNEALRRLVALTDPDEITAFGVELAVATASPGGARLRRACYYRIVDGCVEVQALHDHSGEAVLLDRELPEGYGEDWLLDEHPGVRRAVATRETVAARVDLDQVGPLLRPSLEQLGVTYGAWVPVCVGGEVHGVLAVAGEGVPVPAEAVSTLTTLGRVIELALSNWAAHEQLREQATLEERRRIARELHDGLAHELAFIASKTRGARAEGSTKPLDVRALAGAADRALDEARRAITVLSVARPLSVDDAVAQTAEDMGARFG